MFAQYPVAATADNWVHDCLVTMLEDVHNKLKTRSSITKWPECFPLKHQKKLKNRAKLKQLRTTYVKALRSLNSSEQAQVLRCMREQNQISALLNKSADCECISDLPEIIRQPASQLFDFGFDLIKQLGIRDQHYCLIYNSLTRHDCPFCGIEPFDAPVGTGTLKKPHARNVSEDLDHYLPKSRYPFAAANLRNLAPAGGKCNSFKLEQDILRDKGGNRVAAFDPYNHEDISITLEGSAPFGGKDGQFPKWKIEFIPNSAKCKTWDRIYNIKDRWIKNELDPHYQEWLRAFAEWLVRRNAGQSITKARLLKCLRVYADDEALSNRSGRERFRELAIRMLLRQCQNGQQRLVNQIFDVIKYAIPPVKP
jgi:hypothetical protein